MMAHQWLTLKLISWEDSFFIIRQICVCYITSTLNLNKLCFSHCVWRRHPSGNASLVATGTQGCYKERFPEKGQWSLLTPPTWTLSEHLQRRNGGHIAKCVCRFRSSPLLTIDFLLCVPIFTWKCNKTVIIPTLPIFLPDRAPLSPSPPALTRSPRQLLLRLPSGEWLTTAYQPLAHHTAGTVAQIERKKKHDWGDRQRRSTGGWWRRCSWEEMEEMKMERDSWRRTKHCIKRSNIMWLPDQEESKQTVNHMAKRWKRVKA